MYDVIVTDLDCAYCGTHAPAVEIQTRMFAQPALRRVAVGDPVVVAPDLGASTYLEIGASRSGCAVLEPWSCPRCGAWRWARIEVQDDHLSSVTAVPFTETVLVASDYIADDLYGMLSDLDRRQIGDTVALRRALLRIQQDIDAHRDDHEERT